MLPLCACTTSALSCGTAKALISWSRGFSCGYTIAFAAVIWPFFTVIWTWTGPQRVSTDSPVYVPELPDELVDVLLDALLEELVDELDADEPDEELEPDDDSVGVGVLVEPSDPDPVVVPPAVVPLARTVPPRLVW
jgi:hypothetical protein